MRIATIRERLLQRVSEVLHDGSTDDIFLAADQLRVVAGALAALNDDDEVDLSNFTVDTAQASRMLSYHAEHVRRLIRQGTIRATKVGADYRIPLLELFTVLVRRHRDDAAPDLLPNSRPVVEAADQSDEGDLEVAIDVSIVRSGQKRATHIQRFSIELSEIVRLYQIASGSPSASATANS